MAERFDNQYTTPAFTESEWIERFRKLLPCSTGRGARERKDLERLFIEFVRSSYSDYKGIKQFCVAKKMCYSLLQRRGGASFWNRARHYTHTHAMAVAFEKSPGIVEERFENESRVANKILKLLEHATDRLARTQQNEIEDPENATVSPYELDALKEMADSMKKITETNAIILHGGINKHELKSVNLHAYLIDAIKERDKQFGIEEKSE